MKFIALFMIVILAFTAVKADSLKVPAQEVLDTVEGILVGAFGADAKGAVSCIEDGETIFADIEEAIKEFEKGGVTNIVQGLYMVGKALEELPTEFKDCEAAEGLLVDFEKIIKEFEDPKDLVVHVGEEILWHGKDIYGDINGASANFHAAKYEPAGEQIGDIVKILLVEAKSLRGSNGPAQETIDTVEGILVGAFGDEGKGASVCLKDGEDIFFDIENAIKDFEKGGVTNIIAGLYNIGLALEELPEEFKECEGAEPILADIEKIAAEFKNPKDLAIHVGTEVLWHGKDIYGDITGATADFKDGKYEPAGEMIGDIIKILLVETAKELLKISA